MKWLKRIAPFIVSALLAVALWYAWEIINLPRM